MFAKYFHSDPYDGRYRQRGTWNRLTKHMKLRAKQARRKNLKRLKQPVPQEYLDHIGGYIEVVTCGFGDKFYQYGYLQDIDLRSKYVLWTSHGHTMPPVHIDNVKLLK